MSEMKNSAIIQRFFMKNDERVNFTLLLKTGVGRCVFNLRFLKSKSFGLVVGQ